jgi:hypothetical protein
MMVHVRSFMFTQVEMYKLEVRFHAAVESSAGALNKPTDRSDASDYHGIKTENTTDL